MNDERRNAVRRIFIDVVDLSGAERVEALTAACGDDHALRAEVERILGMDARAGDFMNDPTHDAFGDLTVHAAPREHEGQSIDRFRLLEQIGEGGFGAVWAAEQREPVKRRVALKVIKLGMDTEQVIARFEAERQALAMMDHPNIAKIFDAGATESGRPYFVMELVKGIPIVEYCDTERLSTPERLALFVKVCHAIQHAHQKGVIHRDVKPSNVLVTSHDGEPVPKVIDFGIAKATSAQLTEKTIYTQHRQMVGTPAYMSPEQAEMSGLDIDTRSDVYSLGVLLYELLTGTTPFDAESLMAAGYAEMMRIIREDEPHKPSTRLSSLGATGSRTAERRRTEIGRLGATVRGDLDWIAMKCLEKDRRRRYDTASGLAADIARFLADEPVLAGPPTTAYRFRKFVRRNRGGVIAGLMVSLVLLGGVIGTSRGFVWALREKANADTHAAAATDAKLQAEANESRALEIKRFVVEMVSLIDPGVAQTADTSLIDDMLDDTASRLEAGEIADPLVAAELHQLVGRLFGRLARYAEAEAHLERALAIVEPALGGEAEQTLAVKQDLHGAYRDLGRTAEAKELLEAVIDACRRRFGDDHPNTVTALANMALILQDEGDDAGAEELLVSALEHVKRIFGEDDLETADSLSNLAVFYTERGRHVEAEPLMLRSVELYQHLLGPTHPKTLLTMGNLAILYRNRGELDKAEPIYRETLQLQKDVLGEGHEDTLRTMNNLAVVCNSLGKREEAVSLYVAVIDGMARIPEADPTTVMNAKGNLAIVYEKLGRFDEAEPLYIEVLETRERLLGADHPAVLVATINLGFLYNATERHQDAAELFERSMAHPILHPTHEWIGSVRNGLARAYVGLGRHDDAFPLQRDLLEGMAAQADHPGATALMLNNTAWEFLNHAVESLHDPDRALRWAERACAQEEERGGGSLAWYLDTLAQAQYRTGDVAGAVATQRRAIERAGDQVPDEMRERLEAYEEDAMNDRGPAG